MKLRAALVVLASLLAVLIWLLPARGWVSSARPAHRPVARSLAAPPPLPRAGSVVALDGGLAIIESVEHGVVTYIEGDAATGRLQRRSCMAAACPPRLRR